MPAPENRRDWLLKEVARALDHGINPFSLSWWSEHGVTSEESLALTDTIAAIILGYLTASLEVKAAVMKAYASSAMMEVLTNDL